MNAALAFSVLGVAVPFTRVVPGRNGAAHRDAKTRHWESLVQDAAAAAMDRAKWATTRGAVRCDLTFVLVLRPTKKKRKVDHAYPIAGKGMGDLDNLAKAVLDAMQRAGVFKNDVQVVTSVLEKRWQAPREQFAGVIVRIEVI